MREEELCHRPDTVRDLIAILVDLPLEAALQIEVSDENYEAAEHELLMIEDIFIAAETGAVVLQV